MLLHTHVMGFPLYLLVVFGLINPACAVGAITVVVLWVCLSVTKLAATYLVHTSQVRCHRVAHGIFKTSVVWVLLKTLRSKVLV